MLRPTNKDRLPTDVIPSHYDLAFKTDIESGTFDGKAIIHLTVRQQTCIIYLNAHETLGLREIKLLRKGTGAIVFPLVEKRQGVVQRAPLAYLDENDQLVLKLIEGEDLSVGEAGVTLQFSWKSSLRDDTKGYYTSPYGAPVDGQRRRFALTHFECDSARKAYPSWDEPSLKATFSISMIAKDEMKCLSCMPETTAPNATQLVLADSLGAQMSTYLTAMACGPFKCLSDSYVSVLNGKTIPLATWATEEDYKDTWFTLESMKGSLAHFEELFQLPYPLPKLDLLSAANFTFGAMENFGLMFRALTFDASRDTHAILDETLQTIQELEGTWDEICYSKSPAVVAMIAAYVGEEKFFKGIREFLRKPHSVATRHDLWKAIADSEKDVVSFAQKWITAEGYPVITVKKTETGISLSQKRFLQTGDLKEQEDGVVWPIPLNIKTFSGNVIENSELLYEKEITMSVSPDAVFKLNADSRCLYLVQYPLEMLQNLMQLAGDPSAGISAEDRIGLLNECVMLAAAGHYPPSIPLDLALCMKNERRHLWGLNTRVTVGLKALMREIFVPMTKHLSFDNKRNEPVKAPVARVAAIVGAMLGEDPDVTTEALRRFDEFVETNDIDRIPSDFRSIIMGKAVEVRGVSATKRLKEFYLSSSDDVAQQQALVALASILDEPDLIKTMDWTLKHALPHHLRHVISAATRNANGCEAAIIWLMENFGRVSAVRSTVPKSSS
ncbi:hypothetical protein QFC21_007082 [Naganishia friedmannii]|uniref:Uncharacterized protein n=1 Tax=Naganishia friedmannii TaxID=89922 RepID=A0ACC2UXH2_9TREE|nr:hypothetical protein QFC21_007082 [Naganishia friedmannii]